MEKIIFKEEKYVEDIWLELIEKDKPPDVFLDITKKLIRIKKKYFALNLLKLLILHYIEKQNYNSTIAIQKEILKFEKTKENIHQLIKYYEKVLNTNLNKIHQQVEEKKPPEIINTLDKYLYFNIGEYFLHKIWGIGKVIELNINEDIIKIDFKNRIENFKINEGTEYLEKIPKKHFLVIKYENIEKVKCDAINNQVELMKSIIKSYKEITEDEIKKLLPGIVDNIDDWLKDVKRHLKKEKEIRISGTQKKIFTYLPPDKIEEVILEDFEKAELNQKFKILKDIKDKFNNIYNNLIENLKNDLKNLSYHQATEVLLFLYDLKELSQKELKEYFNSKSIDELFEILSGLKSLKYKKILFDYIIKVCAKDLSAVAPTGKPYHYLNKICALDKELFEYFLKISDKNEILDYFNDNYKFYPEKFIQFIIHYKEEILQDKEILFKILEILYKEKSLRKYAYQIIDINSINFNSFTYYEIIDIQNKICEIFSDDINARLKIKIHSQKEYPQLVADEDEIIYAASYSIKKRKEELEYIESVEIPKNTREIAKARAYGDLSENYEYKAAKERQGMLYTRLNELRNELKRTVEINNVISEKDIVSIGKKVILKTDSETKQFTILGLWDAIPEKNIISCKSPIAKVLLGKKVGEVIEIEDKKYKIVKINRENVG